MSAFNFTCPLQTHKDKGYNKKKLKAYDMYLYLEKATKLKQAFCHLLSQGKYSYPRALAGK